MFYTNSPSSTSIFEATKIISTNFSKNLIFPKFDTSTLVIPSNIFKKKNPSSSTKEVCFNEKSNIILIQILKDNAKDHFQISYHYLTILLIYIVLHFYFQITSNSQKRKCKKMTIIGQHMKPSFIKSYIIIQIQIL